MVVGSSPHLREWPAHQSWIGGRAARALWNLGTCVRAPASPRTLEGKGARKDRALSGKRQSHTALKAGQCRIVTTVKPKDSCIHCTIRARRENRDPSPASILVLLPTSARGADLPRNAATIHCLVARMQPCPLVRALLRRAMIRVPAWENAVVASPFRSRPATPNHRHLPAAASSPGPDRPRGAG